MGHMGGYLPGVVRRAYTPIKLKPLPLFPTNGASFKPDLARNVSGIL